MRNRDRQIRKNRRLSSRIFIGFAAGVFSFLTIASWSISSPVGASPDEGIQLATVWCANGLKDDICKRDDEGKLTVSVGLINWCYQHEPATSAGCTKEIDHKAFTTIGGGSFLPVNLWYKFLSLFAGNPIDQHVIFIRIIGATTILAVAIMVFFKFDRNHRYAFLITGLVSLTPTGIYLLNSAHPSGAVAGVILIGAISSNQILTNYPRKKILKDNRLLFTITFVCAFWLYNIRRETLIFFIAFLTLLVIAKLYDLKRISKIFVALIAPISILAIAGVYKIQSQFDLKLFPVILKVFGEPADTGRLSEQVFTFNWQNFPTLLIGNFGYWGLGQLDTAMPPLVWVLTLGLFFGILALLIPNSTKTNLVILGLNGLVIVTLILAVLQSSKLYVGENLQPRYLLPLMIFGLATFIANADLSRFSHFDKQLFKAIFILGTSVANSLALWTLLRRFTSGLDVWQLDLNYRREWWWDFFITDGKTSISPNQVWAIGSLSYLLTAIFLLKIISSTSKRMQPMATSELTT